jgi:hypothetical protein
MPIELKPYPEEIRRKRDNWGNDRDAWLKKAEKEEEVYYHDVEGTGTSFTLEQLQKIDKGSGIPVNINFLHPIINHKLAILTQTRPAFKVVGLDDRGKNFAYAIDKAVKSIMYRSEAVGEEEETIKNMLVMGMGISGINELDYYQFGRFDIEYIDLHPSLVILDSNAKKRNMSDMEGYFIEKEITLETAKQKYQHILDRINESRTEAEQITFRDLSTSISTLPSYRGTVHTDGFNDKVIVSEYYSKVFTTMYFITDPETGDVLRVFEENLDENTNFILDAAESAEIGMYIKKTLFLGNYQVAEEIKPIRDFPIKVKFFEWGGRPYKSYGMPHFLIGMQEASDKAVQSMLLNGMLTNNAGYMSPKGGITQEDKPKWETIGNKPGVIKEYQPVTIDGVTLKPEREQIQPLSNFYPTIVEMMKNGMEFSSGVLAVLRGDAESGIDVFSSLQQYQDAAMKRIQLAMSHINLANEQLGNVIIDYLLANLKLSQNYAFFDEENNLQELTVLSKNVKDFKLGRYSVLSISAEAMPTQKIAMATEMMKIAQTTPDPMDRNIYIQKAFQLSDMRGFDDVQETIDVKNKLSQRIQVLEEQIKRDEELLKQLENRAINAEYQAKLQKKLSGMESEFAGAEEITKLKLEIERQNEYIKELKSKNKTVDKK